jgi:hypothetical protein
MVPILGSSLCGCSVGFVIEYALLERPSHILERDLD